MQELYSELLQVLNRVADSIVGLLPKVIGSALIIVVGLLLARIIRSIVVRLFRKVHYLFPGKSLRSRIQHFTETDTFTRLVGSIFYWLIVLMTLTVATETLGLPVITTWISGVVGYLPNVLLAVLIIVIGVISGAIVRDFISTAAASAGMLHSELLSKFTQIALVTISIFIGIDQLGIDVTLIEILLYIILSVFLLGAALTFSLGARDSVNNILAAYYLKRVYKTGDTVKVGDIEGVIVQFAPHAVIVDTPEGRACIPASKFNEEKTVLTTGQGSS